MRKSPWKIYKEALVFNLCILGSELFFIRTVGDPQKPLSILLTLITYCLVTWPLLAISERWSWAKIRRYTSALAASLPAFLTCMGTSILDYRKRQTALALVVVAVVTGLITLGTFLYFARRRSERVLPPPWVAMALVMFSLSLTVVVKIIFVPPVGLIVGLMLGFGLLLLSTRDRRTLAGALAATVVIALLPHRPFAREIKWDNAPKPTGGPDIFLIIIDALRKDVADEMAVFKRLKKEGVDHAEAQSAAPWTLPSTGTIFTGELPHVHGALNDRKNKSLRIREDLTTLPMALNKLGYDCAAVVSENPYISPRYGFSRGFSIYDRHGSHDRFHARFYDNDRISKLALIRLILRHQNMLTFPVLWHILDGLPIFPDADFLVDRALRFIGQRRPDHPLFFFLHFLEPHLPYHHAYRADVPFNFKRLLHRTRLYKMRDHPFWQSDQVIAFLKTAYRGEAEVVDKALMRFLDALGPAGPNGRVIVLTSDHGEEFFDHGGFEHGHSFYQELLHVPLVTTGLPKSNILGHTRKDRVVGLIDIAPALIAAADGHSNPSLHLGYVAENPLYSPPPTYYKHRKQNIQNWAVRIGNIKTIEQKKKMQFFNLKIDPEEQTPLRGITHEQHTEIEKLRPGKAAKGTQVNLSEEEKAVLRSLGYIQE